MEEVDTPGAEARPRSRRNAWIATWVLSVLAAAGMLHYFLSYRPTFEEHVSRMLSNWSSAAHGRLTIAFDACTLVATLVTFAAFFRYLRPRDTTSVRLGDRSDIQR